MQPGSAATTFAQAPDSAGGQRPAGLALDEVGRWPPVRRALVVAVAYQLAWTTLDLVAGQFQAAEGVSVWAPPPALDLALLLFLGVRWTPLLLLSTSFNAALVTPAGLGPLPVAVLALVHAMAYGGAAHLLLRVVRIDPRLPTQRDVVCLLALGSGAAALLAAAAQVALLCASGVVPWAAACGSRPRLSC